jgi:hypothetical protein
MILMVKPEGKGLLGRPRRRWVDSIEMNLREIVWNESIWLRIGTRIGSYEHGNELSGSIKCWKILE